MATVPDTETHVTSAADAMRTAEAASRPSIGILGAATCVLLPGYCVAAAADAERREALAAGVEESGERLEAEAGSIASGAASIIRESASPIGELSSAARYASVAATVVVIAVVIAVVAVVVRSYAPLPRLG